MRILCVDDDNTYLELLRIILTRCGTEDEIYTASNSTDGFALIKKYTFDLIITDLVMSGLSGLDLLRSVKEINPGCEVIVLSATDSVNAAVKAMQLGARDFITKPLNSGVVAEKLCLVRDLIDRRKEAEEYRHAKEMIESGAQQTITELECKVNLLQATLCSIKEILDKQQDTTKTIAEISTLLCTVQIQL